MPESRECLTEADSPHGLRSKGHCCWEEGVLTHLSIQCIWKMCWHLPNTAGQSVSVLYPLKRLAITREGLTERTVVTREFTIRTARVVRDSTDTAEVFIVFLLLTQLPSPLRDGVPLLDDYFHDLTFPRLRFCHLWGLFGLWRSSKTRALFSFPGFPMSGTQSLRLRKPQPASTTSSTPKARQQDGALLKDAVRKYVLPDAVVLHHD